MNWRSHSIQRRGGRSHETPPLFVFGLLLIALGGCVLTHSVLAQVVTKSVGSPSCLAFNDYSGDHCYELKCNPSPDDYLKYDTCDDMPVSTVLYGVQLCEIPPNSGTITRHITYK